MIILSSNNQLTLGNSEDCIFLLSSNNQLTLGNTEDCILTTSMTIY